MARPRTTTPKLDVQPSLPHSSFLLSSSPAESVRLLESECNGALTLTGAPLASSSPIVSIEGDEPANSEKLVGMLRGLISEDSIASLRLRLAEVRASVAGVGSCVGGSGASTLQVDADKLDREYALNQLDQIAESQTIERAKYYLERLVKALTEVRTSDVNDLNLNRWQEYSDVVTDSLWVLDKRDSSGVHNAGYWGNFIPQIPNQMMKRYTKKGDWVLDTFLGSGTTLIEAQRLGRNAIGIELQESIADKARTFIASEPNAHDTVTKVVVDDSTTVDYAEVLSEHQRRTVQLVVMHPPYHDIIRFSDDPRDLSNAPTVDGFLEMLGRVVDNASRYLDAGRYLALVIGDKYSRGEWIPLGFLSMNQVLQRGFSLKSVVIKNFDQTAAKRNQQKLWRYRALVGGFYVFKHEYVFIFRKRT